MPLNLFTVDLRTENDIVLARQKARMVAEALKFDRQDQARVATAVSEIARNTYQYGDGGRVQFRLDDVPAKMLTIAFQDTGKGIANLDEILDGNYVSETGMGIGLLGAKRLMDHFEIQTKPGKGTTVVLGKKVPSRFHKLDSAELNRLLAAIENAGQNPYEELQQQNRELMATLQELRTRQDELAQLNRELDETNRGVVALYAELNDKAVFLQKASELKSHFLSNMSHEFRTPLNSITALSSILLERLDGELTPEQEKQVKYIRSSAQELMELVNDLLDLAKVEAGKVTVRPDLIRVDGLFAGLRGMLRPLLNQNSAVNLVFEDPVDIPEIFSDEGKISQILRNFISNALKFTERGEIRISVTQPTPETVLFSVADTGIGIAPEDQERIFLEWTQVEGRLQKAAKGTGLGLPLSRKFARLLGGEVYVQSEPGLGSTFFAEIPIRYGLAAHLVQAPNTKIKLLPGKWPILAVEDSPETILIYEKYVQNSDFQLIPAATIDEARAVLRTIVPAAVILDVLLQGEHSWDLLQDLKRDSRTAGIPVLVITIVENRDKALALGADAFHAKPVEKTWLLRQLHQLTGHHLKQVLLIDDDEVSKYLLKNYLSHTDLRFSEASTAGEGISKALENPPEAVILDIDIPDQSGFEVLRKLKSEARTRQVPVIIYSSRILSEDERGLLHEATAILSKDSTSREAAVENFTEAFRKAGISLNVPSTSEHQNA